MAEGRSIPFSGPMVRALLDGRKTQTRRAVKDQDALTCCGDSGDEVWVHWDQLYDEGGERPVLAPQWLASCADYPEEGAVPLGKGYGRPGDLLYVKEAWRTRSKLDPHTPKEIERRCLEAGFGVGPAPACPIRYEADGLSRPWGERDLDDFGDWGRYRHTRFMPRWASRLTLRITDVRVERLQDINDEDALAEGIQYTDFGARTPSGAASLDGGRTYHPFKPKQQNGYHTGNATHPDQCHATARGAFAGLWSSINGPGSWEANPWVWALTFDVIHANVDEVI